MVSELNGWNEADQAHNLAVCLRGTALQVLTDLSPDDRRNYDRLMDVLNTRFGPANRAEMYMAELKGRRRHKGEPLRELGQEIRRLTSLAYPGMAIEWRERMAQQHFQDAVDDAEIRVRLFQATPQTLEQAITLALETENFYMIEARRNGGLPRPKVKMVRADDYEEDEAPVKGNSVSKREGATGNEAGRDKNRKGNGSNSENKGGPVKQLQTKGSHKINDEQLESRLSEIEKSLSSLTKLLESFKMGNTSQGLNDSSQGRQRRPKSSVQCWTCGEFGHYSSEHGEPGNHGNDGYRTVPSKDGPAGVKGDWRSRTQPQNVPNAGNLGQLGTGGHGQL
jgi:hypothetical protein